MLAHELRGPLAPIRNAAEILRLRRDADGGDPVRLAQVVANLLSNAAKYSDPGTPIEARAERDGGQVEIRVRDRGIGMPQELLDQVFDQFFQAERSLDRDRGGLGLGLTLVKSLVEMHGGSVSAASEGPGHGSELTVRLPAAPGVPAPGEPTAPDAEGEDRGPRRRVLVVDDSVDTAESFGELLRLSGHEVAVAHGPPSTLG